MNIKHNDEIKKKAEERFKELLPLVKVIIERDFKPCKLDKHLETILYDLSYKAIEKNWTGWKIIIYGVFYADELARSLAEKYDKGLCHYLDMALKNAWIERYVLALSK
jgi:hypothetical protein